MMSIDGDMGYEGRGIIENLEIVAIVSEKETAKILRAIRIKALLKFHDRASLVCGVMAGVALSGTGGIVVHSGNWVIGWFQVAVGLVLAIHCLDMLRYWKRHRIVRIVKTDTERLIYKENPKRRNSNVS